MNVPQNASNKTARLVGSLCSVFSLVVGIPCLFVSFVPLVGALAFFPSLFALVCAVAGLVLAVKAGTSTGASITGLVITLLAFLFSYGSYMAISDAKERFEKRRQERTR